MKLNYKGFYLKKYYFNLFPHFLNIKSYNLPKPQNGVIMEDKTIQVPITMTIEQREILKVFSKKVAHAGTLAGWLKSLAFREIDHATPEQKQKFNELMGA